MRNYTLVNQLLSARARKWHSPSAIGNKKQMNKYKMRIKLVFFDFLLFFFRVSFVSSNRAKCKCILILLIEFFLLIFVFFFFFFARLWTAFLLLLIYSLFESKLLLIFNDAENNLNTNTLTITTYVANCHATVFNFVDWNFQVESNVIDKSKIKVEEAPVSDEEKQKLQQQQQQQSQNAPQALIVASEIASLPSSGDGNDGTVESPAVTSALPTTVITTQRHRMITTAGHIRFVVIFNSFTLISSINVQFDILEISNAQRNHRHSWARTG